MEEGCSVGFWGTLGGTEVLSSFLLKPLLEGQDPFLQQPLQQAQDQLLSEQQMQEQPQPPSTVVGRQNLQIYLPGRASVAVPLCEDHMTFMHTQPIVPVQLAAGQQPSGCYQGDTLRDEEDDSPR